MEQNNKLIAEFMELETPDGVFYEYLTKDGNRSKPTHFMLLEYHLSWDWLMPVVQKIGNEYYNTPFDETYSKLTEQYENIWTLEDTYNAVVEFIKDQNTEVIGSFNESGDLI